MLKDKNQVNSETDPETSVSLIHKRVTIDEDKKKLITFNPFVVKLVISLVAIILLVLIPVLVFCFADATRHIRCALADSLGLTLKQCGVKGTLESLNRGPALSQNSSYDVRKVEVDVRNYTSITELNDSISDHIIEWYDGGNFTKEQKAYIELAESSWETAWEILNDKDGWKFEAGKSLTTGMVYSKSYENFPSVFKLKGYVDASPEELFNLFVIEAKFSEWSPIIDTSYVIEQVTDNIRIVYSTTTQLALGFIEPRDYVNLSHWKSRDGVVLQSITAATHPDYPENDTYIRAENRPGGLLFRPVKNEPNKCQLEWSVSTKMGGWMPEWLVDNGKADSMLEFFSNIRDKVARLKQT